MSDILLTYTTTNRYKLFFTKIIAILKKEGI